MFAFSSGRRCKAELKSSKSQNEELRKTLELMEGQIRARVRFLYSVKSVTISLKILFPAINKTWRFPSQDRERGDEVNREQSVNTRAEQLQTALFELESRCVCFLRHGPYYDGGIWKHGFICTVRRTVHTKSTRKRSFSKMLFKLEEFENVGFSF